MKQFFKVLIVFILQWEAKQILKKYKPKIVAVTGSVGKTSTKDAIYTVLASRYFVRKSEKSFNSDIGVPLTILGCPNGWNNPFIWLSNIFKGLELILFRADYPAWLVLEIGADSLDPTYITRLMKWVIPDIAVFTSFAKIPVHVEFFGSRENLFKEKMAVLEAVKREGTVIVNFDDTELFDAAKALETNLVSFGFTGGAVMAAQYKVVTEQSGNGTVPVGISFKASTTDDHALIAISGSLGRQQVYPLLAALSVGQVLGMKFADMAAALSAHDGPRGRMRILAGLKGSTIIDDTYNSSPVAVIEALESFKHIPNVHRKIAMLGDMMELGKQSGEAHREIGALAARSVDMLITVGIRSRKMAETAIDSGLAEKNVYQFDTSQEAGGFIQNYLEVGDIVLVKGSQSTRMERAVKEIMAEPKRAAELLVRQEQEWEER